MRKRGNCCAFIQRIPFAMGIRESLSRSPASCTAIKYRRRPHPNPSEFRRGMRTGLLSRRPKGCQLYKQGRDRRQRPAVLWKLVQDYRYRHRPDGRRPGGYNRLQNGGTIEIRDMDVCHQVGAACTVSRIAHQGIRGYAPFNTMPAFQTAARAWFRECGEYQPHPGLSAVLHDDTIDATANGTGKSMI